MKLRDLRRYEVQAACAAALALAAVVPLIAAVLLVWRNYRHDIGQIIYGTEGLFLPLFLASLILSVGLGGLGFVLGWNSAGQRRNDRPGRSWMGFFLGGAVLTSDIILLVAFVMLRFAQPT